MHHAGTVSELGEKELIRSIIKPLLNPTDDPNSIGDDCAAIPVDPGSLVCVSTDRVPADLISFRLGIIQYRGLGYYLAVLNLSDLAAMGARPAGLLLNLGLPPDTRIEDLVEFLEGAKNACAEHGCRVLGGDLSNSAELSMSATSIGTASEKKLLRRRGAKVGDLVFCADPIGLSATAFAYFLQAKPKGFQLTEAEEQRLKDQFQKPRPRFDVSAALVELGQATAMDNTDGVGQTLSELAEINHVGIRVETALLPLHELSRKIAESLKTDVSELVLGAGADFQLIGTVAPHVRRDALPQDVKFIGEVVAGEGVLISRDHGTVRLEVKGWNYFIPLNGPIP